MTSSVSQKPTVGRIVHVKHCGAVGIESGKCLAAVVTEIPTGYGLDDDDVIKVTIFSPHETMIGMLAAVRRTETEKIVRPPQGYYMFQWHWPELT